jgi:hypothetical protein
MSPKGEVAFTVGGVVTPKGNATTTMGVVTLPKGRVTTTKGRATPTKGGATNPEKVFTYISRFYKEPSAQVSDRTFVGCLGPGR